MKSFFEALIIVLALISLMFFVFLFVVKYASGANGLSGKTVIDHSAETITYNESVEFDVNMSAHINESDCVKCLRQFPIESCWGIGTCLNVKKD